MHDRRLLGTWRSDKRRTMREIEARKDFTPKAKEFLDGMFGHLVLHYTRTRCHSTFRETTASFPYRVVARNPWGVLVVCSQADEPEDTLLHIHFEGDDVYWIALGSFREFFRRVPPRPAARTARRSPPRPRRRR